MGGYVFVVNMVDRTLSEIYKFELPLNPNPKPNAYRQGREVQRVL